MAWLLKPEQYRGGYVKTFAMSVLLQKIKFADFLVKKTKNLAALSRIILYFNGFLDTYILTLGRLGVND